MASMLSQRNGSVATDRQTDNQQKTSSGSDKHSRGFEATALTNHDDLIRQT